jgi:ISXO2-like transposase domain/Transposase zinc-ribbon domain
LAQHVLLSARYRDLPIAKIARLSEGEAYAMFRMSRWPETDGEAVCPECGGEAWTLGDHAMPKDKRQFRCMACRGKFTVTSGTLLHSRKLGFVTLLIAVKLFSSGAKGIAAIQLGNEADMAYKSAFVLAQKMREAQIKAQLGRQLSGIVEIDGSIYGGYYHQVNEKADRVDLRKGDLTGKKMTIVVARERSTPERVGLSVCTVVPHEADSRPFIFDSVDRMASVHADDGSHWDSLRVALNVDQVNHSQRYFDKGVCTNQAESYFSRVQRMELGTHHHIAGPYLWGYGCDGVWREDHRRETQAERFDSVLSGLLQNTVSRTMKGYWQRHLEPVPFEADPIDMIVGDANDDDAVAVAREVAEDEGRMSRDDVIKAFGPDAADAMLGPGQNPRRRKWKARKPFAPKRVTARPEPWSELKRSLGLPSFVP